MMTAHKVGDIVTPNPDAGWARRMIGTLFVITDLPRGRTGVNYKASPCDKDGKALPGQGLRGPDWSLLPVTSGDAPAATVTIEAYVPLPPVASIVRSTSPTRPVGYYVVIGHTDATRARIMAIGDTSGRYYRAASSGLEIVDPALIIAALDAVGA